MMSPWPDQRVQELLGIELPVIQAPMAGANLSAMAIAVSQAGGLGSLPCAMLSTDQMQAEIEAIRRQAPHPINVNFFCHQTPVADAELDLAWKKLLAKYYVELGLASAPAERQSPSVRCHRLR